MGIKLGDVSPLAGLMTGKGMLGNAIDSAGYGLGLVPGMMSEKRRKERHEKEDAAKMSATPAQPGMKKGGKVSSASKRADGCATKGKTKGRMV